MLKPESYVEQQGMLKALEWAISVMWGDAAGFDEVNYRREINRLRSEAPSSRAGDGGAVQPSNERAAAACAPPRNHGSLNDRARTTPGGPAHAGGSLAVRADQAAIAAQNALCASWLADDCVRADLLEAGLKAVLRALAGHK